jgi:hypothetical protein
MASQSYVRGSVPGCQCDSSWLTLGGSGAEGVASSLNFRFLLKRATGSAEVDELDGDGKGLNWVCEEKGNEFCESEFCGCGRCGLQAEGNGCENGKCEAYWELLAKG